MSIRAPTPQQMLGLRVKELRALQELTQEELADRCGVFRTYMSRIESGRANPTLTMLHTLAQGLEVVVTELLTPAQTQPSKVRAKRPLSRGRVTR